MTQGLVEGLQKIEKNMLHNLSKDIWQCITIANMYFGTLNVQRCKKMNDILKEKEKFDLYIGLS